VTPAYVIGYDPGGNGAHGTAVVEVQKRNSRWEPTSMQVRELSTLSEALGWMEEACHRGRVVAAGIDTLTEWNSGPSGWRPGDLWLKRIYPAVANKVVSPNSVAGSMAVNGAAFLTMLQPRFQTDGTMVTEAHPKVYVYALLGRRYKWAEDGERLREWLLDELGVSASTDIRFGDRPSLPRLGETVIFQELLTHEGEREEVRC
jgi:hypothetical protein